MVLQHSNKQKRHELETPETTYVESRHDTNVTLVVSK